MTQSFLSRVIESFHDHNQSTDRLDSASVAWDREIISKHTAKTSPLPFPRPHSGFGLNAVKQLTAIPPVFDLRLATANSVQILISLSLSFSGERSESRRRTSRSRRKLNLLRQKVQKTLAEMKRTEGEREVERENLHLCERIWWNNKQKKLKNKGGGEGCS